MKKILDYLKQPSTWRGLIALATAIGVALTPEQVEAVVTAGVSAVALIEVFRNEKK
jgi:hypothetical protein